jgi:hypothetical protein
MQDFLYVGVLFFVYQYEVESGAEVRHVEGFIFGVLLFLVSAGAVQDIIVHENTIYTCGEPSIKQWQLDSFELQKQFLGLPWNNLL